MLVCLDNVRVYDMVYCDPDTDVSGFKYILLRDLGTRDTGCYVDFAAVTGVTGYSGSSLVYDSMFEQILSDTVIRFPDTIKFQDVPK